MGEDYTGFGWMIIGIILILIPAFKVFMLNQPLVGGLLFYTVILVGMVCFIAGTEILLRGIFRR